MTQRNEQKLICLGAFAGAHGVKGETKLRTFTAQETDIASYGDLCTEDRARKFSLKVLRVLKPGVALARSPQIKTREDAEALKGTRLYVPREALTPPEEDEFYLEDLVGLAAVDDAGAPAGKVSAVHNFGAGDILELTERPNGAPDIMVPFTREGVPDVDIAAGKITVAAAFLGDENAENDIADEVFIETAIRQEDA